MSDSLIQLPAIASGASFAGTCLMHTIIFTEFFFPESKTKLRPTLKGMLFAGPALKNERGVGAAKPKGIRKRVFHGRFARVIRNVIQIALGIRSLVIDGRRQNLVAQSEHADPCFQSAGSAEQMSGHGLGRAYWDFLSALAEDALQRHGLEHITDRSRSA